MISGPKHRGYSYSIIQKLLVITIRAMLQLVK